MMDIVCIFLKSKMISALLNKSTGIQNSNELIHKRIWFGQAHKCNENMNIILCHNITKNCNENMTEFQCKLRRGETTHNYSWTMISQKECWGYLNDRRNICKYLTTGTAGCKRKTSDKAA